MAKVEWAVRQLTANLLRVTRGAGNAWEIGKQAQGLIEALIEYREVTGAYPSSYEITDALAIWRKQADLESISDDRFDEISAEEAIIRGALRIVAARLLGQRLQEAAGDSEMSEGLRRRDALLAKWRRELAASAKTAAKGKARRKITRSRRPRTRVKKPKG
jgi:hypothetical protein